MNPLLSFWMKVQPLSHSFGTHTWKAISQSSAVASSSGDDATVTRTATSSSWAFECLNTLASRALRSASSSWLLNPMITRMQDAPILKPSPRTLCEGLQRYPTRKVDASRVDGFAKSRSGEGAAAPTSLQQAQKVLQQQDYINYQMPPPPVRRNSKEWVREYKKERIDKINYNNVFGGMGDGSNNEMPTLPPPAADVKVKTEDGLAGGRSPASISSNYLLHPNSPATSTSSSTTMVPDSVVSSLSPLAPSAPSKTTSNDKPDDVLCPDDVICGRGGKANTHPGNVAFREEAKKLRSWYESSSKSEKFTISSFLVDVVRERGGRFLKRDPERSGRWLEADGVEVRKKASQALREGRRSQ